MAIVVGGGSEGMGRMMAMVVRGGGDGYGKDDGDCWW